MAKFAYSLAIMPLILLLSACQNDGSPMADNALYQEGGLWQINTKIVSIDGLDEEEASKIIAETNANNDVSNIQECRSKLTFADSPKKGTQMDAGKEQGMICTYDSSQFTQGEVTDQAVVSGHVICRSSDGEQAAEINITGQSTAKSYEMNIATIHAGGVSNIVLETGQFIGPCPN